MEESLVKIFPKKLLEAMEGHVASAELQEIRIKINKPCIILNGINEVILDYITTKEDVKYIIQRVSNFSLYAYEEDIRQGFITIRGGHRVGLAGECVMENGYIKTIRNISSLNIRVCRQIIGCSKEVLKYILKDNEIQNTVIISPPKCGKTTMLRDIARNFSNMKKKVAIIDERSEIANCYLGVPQMDLGIRCDVLDNCLKSQGMMMAIRSLSPDVIICDEIGTKKDIEALSLAFNSGVKVIASIHGKSISDIYKRSVFKDLIINNILERAIVLSARRGVGTLENVYAISDKEEKTCISLL